MLAAATVRSRWPSFVGAFLALCLGVALITTTLLVLIGSQPQLPRAYAAAAVLVSRVEADGASWSAEAADGIATRLRALGSVAAAVPDRSFYAQLVLDGRARGDPTGGPYGHAWSVVRLSGAQLLAGRGPERDGEVALGADLGPAPGDRVSVLTATGPSTYTVTGVVSGSGIYLNEAMARRLAGGVRVVGLVTKPGADVVAVAAAARSIVGNEGHVLTGSARTALEPPRDRQIRADAGTLLSVMASLSAFVSIFVVASTFALAVSQRRREFGLLRTIGATPRQIRRTLFAEALLVGVLASAAGPGSALCSSTRTRCCCGGPACCRRACRSKSLCGRWRSRPGSACSSRRVVCGVWSASRRAGKVAPLEALREAAVEKRPMTPARWFLGLAATALGVAMVWTSAAATADAAVTTAMFSAMALILGLTLLAPVVVVPFVWLATRPMSGLTAPTVTLVREGARVAVRRVASTAAPVIATVGFTSLMVGIYATLHAFDVAEEAKALPSAVVIVPDATPGLSDAVPGAETAMLSTILFATAANGEEHVLEADGVAPGSPGQADSTTDLTTDAIVVARSAADDLGWSVGAHVIVGFPDGHSARVRVADVLVDEVIPGDVLLRRDVVRAHDPSALAELIYVDGQTADQVNTGLGGLGAKAIAADAYANAGSAADWRMVRLTFILLIGMSVGYTAIAIANTLMMATANRRREFATLRLSGASVGQVLRVVASEAALVVGIGTLLGIAAALTALLGVVSGLRDYIPDTRLVLPWPSVLAVALICLALALAASLIPARLILRQSAFADSTAE